MLTPADFFDLEGFEHRAVFDDCNFVWEALGKRLTEYIAAVLRPAVHGRVMEGAWVDDDAVFVGEGAVIEPGAYVKGPTLIGAGAEVRHGAYIRGNCIIASKAVVGHASEVKGSILLPTGHAPHFAYVGDSILGRKVNLGAGTKLSNLKVYGDVVKLPIDGVVHDTGLRKLGAILGDGCETGCNSVLNPGVLLGRGSIVYPNAAVPKGYYPPGTILKLRQELERAPRR